MLPGRHYVHGELCKVDIILGIPLQGEGIMFSKFCKTEVASTATLLDTTIDSGIIHNVQVCYE